MCGLPWYLSTATKITYDIQLINFICAIMCQQWEKTHKNSKFNFMMKIIHYIAIYPLCNNASVLNLYSTDCTYSRPEWFVWK